MYDQVAEAVSLLFHPSPARRLIKVACENLGIQPGDLTASHLPNLADELQELVSAHVEATQAAYLGQIIRGLQEEVRGARKTADEAQKEIDGRRIDDFTFHRFQISRENEWAFDACRAMARGKPPSPVLFMHGPVGSGKTHLLHAIINEMWDKQPNARIKLITGVDLAESFLDAVTKGKLEEALKTFRNFDMLLIDDIQFLKGEVELQKALAQLFKDMERIGSNIVLTSDRSPEELAGLAQRLVKELETGEIISIAYPDRAARVSILKTVADDQSWIVPEDVLEAVADRCRANLRELRGSLIRVVSFAFLEQRAPDAALVQEILGDPTH